MKQLIQKTIISFYRKKNNKKRLFHWYANDESPFKNKQNIFVLPSIKEKIKA